NARSKMGVQGRPIAPVYDPIVVANAIVYAAEHKVRELYIGVGKMLSVMQRMSPSLTDWYMKRGGRAFRQQMSDRPGSSEGTLFRSSTAAAASHGQFGDEARQSSMYT